MYYENIIIGAGPGGLQCAYFLKKYNIEYLVIEKSDCVGNFFYNYPHAGDLISINKKYTGNDNNDFNLRHDWNSLLNDENLLFTNYSDKFYPTKETLTEYLNDFYEKNNLNIIFNKNVFKIIKKNDKYELYIETTKEKYSCHKLIIATGLSKKNIPNYILNIKNPIKHYGDYPPNYFLNKDNLEEFKNKKVLILGGGNASYELANILNEITSSVFILGKSNRNWAISSHYSGDIRTIYIPFLDTFLLKSQNAIDFNYSFNNYNLIISQNDEEYNVNICINEETMENIPLIPNGRNKYDKIILCTGWKFDNSIFLFDLALNINNKYPHIKTNYESINNKNLYFIGSLMHSLDYRISSGGFIHGFRYLIKSFIHLNYDIKFKYVTFDFRDINNCKQITEHIMNRFNTSSDLYQMFGFLSDIFYYNIEEKNIIYFENVPINSHKPYKKENQLFFILTLEYGNKETNILKIGKKVSSIGTESKSTLIHPVIKIYNSYPTSLIDIVHFDEDLFAEYTDISKYYDKLFRLLKSYL